MTKAMLALLTAIGCLHSFSAAATEYEVTNTSNNMATAGSLPWAVAQVNSGAGTGDIIKFNIPGTGPFIINMTAQLDLIKKVRIDGTTQPGYSTSPLIVISGGGTTSLCMGITANYCAVKGLVINGFSLGLNIFSSFDTVSLCYLGTDATGMTAVNNGTGFNIGSASKGNLIGGIGTGNVISGNTMYGGTVNGIGYNVIQGNYIGLNADGSGLLPNGSEALLIQNNANYNTIGGTAAGAGNVITGNGRATTIRSKYNVIQGNIVGMNAAGTDTIVNRAAGIPGQGGFILANDSNLVGGSMPGAGNYISTAYTAVDVQSGRGNKIQGNYIGLNKAGTVALNNFSNSRIIVWQSAKSTLIGGAAPGEGNVIVSALRTASPGMNLVGDSTEVYGNIVGFDPSMTIPMGLQSAINVNASSVIIGGTGAGEGNVVANCVKSVTTQAASTNCRISGNAIYNNDRGIDFGDNGTAAVNDMPDADGVLNFPVITSVVQAGGNTTIEGIYDGKESLPITLEFFGNDTFVANGYGQGRVYLGNTVVTTDAAGHATFTITAAGTYNVIAATASADGYNTSEFSRTGPLFANASATLNICRNAPATDIRSLLHALDPHIGTTLTWQNALSPGHGILSITSATAASGGSDITPGGTITYKPTVGYVGSDAFRIRITDSKSTVTMTVTVTVHDPAITAANNGPVCGNTTLNVNSSVSGSAPAYSYTWSGPHNFTSATDDNTLYAVANQAAGMYTVVVTDTYGCKDTGTTLVTVNDVPVINSLGGNYPVCTGSYLQLMSLATGGTGLLSYSWSGPGGFSSTGTTQIFPSASPAVAGSYTVIVTDINNCSDSTSTTVALFPRPSITATSNNTPICTANTLQLSSAASGGTGTLTYSWSGPNGFNNTGDSLSVIAAPAAATGTYTVIVTDDNNCNDTGTTAAVINALPAITAIGTSGAVCEDNALSLFSTVTGGSGSYIFAWTGPNSFSSTNEDPLVASSATTAANGTYELMVTDDNNCEATGANTTLVTIYSHQPITGKDSVLFGTAITLSNSVAGGTWSTPAPWKTGVAPATGIVKGVAAGMSQVAYTTGDGCVSTRTVTVLMGANVCVGQTTTLTDTLVGGTWTSNYGSIASVSGTGVVKGIAAGRAVITHRTATAIITTTVTVNALAATSSLPTVCQGQPLTLTNSTPGGGTWYSSNTNTATIGSNGIATGMNGGTVTIYFTPYAGCATEKMITVNAVTPITGPNAVCTGQTVAMSNSTPGGVWSTSAGALAQVTSAGVVKGMANGTPRISYIWPNGCQAVKTMTVNTLSAITGGTPGICASNSMTLANSTPFGGVWSSSNSSAATVNPSSGFVKGRGAGVTIISFTTNVAGCVATRTVTVNACRESGEGTTSVAEAAKEDNITLYPNPNNGQFMITGTLATITDEDVDMEVINMLGQIIFKSTARAQNGNVEKSIELQGNLANGMYLLNIRAGSSTRILRFVVER